MSAVASPGLHSWPRVPEWGLRHRRTVCSRGLHLRLPPSTTAFSKAFGSSRWTLQGRRGNLSPLARGAGVDVAVVILGVAVVIAVAAALFFLGRQEEPAGQKKKAQESKKARDEFVRENLSGILDEEIRSGLPPNLVEALKAFDGDFAGPWEALSLQVEDADLTDEDIRTAYRQAVRQEHPDTSELDDAEERFQRVRKAYAILSDEGSRELLLEAIEQQATSFEELKGLDFEPEEDKGEKRKPSFPWILLLIPGLLFVSAVLFVRVAGPDMQIRSVSKEPMILVIKAEAEAAAKAAAQDSSEGLP